MLSFLGLHSDMIGLMFIVMALNREDRILNELALLI